MFEALTLDDLSTATGGMLRNTSARDQALQTQLTTLQSSLEDLSSAATTTQSKQQDTMNMLMLAMVARQNAG